jgi:D-alanyl-D-alanine carboxypeptidase
MGKFSDALAAVARSRLENEDNTSVTWSKIQVAINDVARSITGARRRDHVTIKDLLNLAGIESANRMVVKDGARNQVGSILFSDNKTATAKTTRSAKTGQITVPLRGGDTLVTHAANVGNRSVSLRAAPTKAAAKKAASDLASLSPL